MDHELKTLQISARLAKIINTKQHKKIMPILCLSCLADKTYVLQLFSPGTVPLDSGHNLIAESLKYCLAIVNGSDLIVYVL